MSKLGYYSDSIKMSIAVTTTAGAAGTSAINGTSVDMNGFDGVCAGGGESSDPERHGRVGDHAPVPLP